MGNLQKEVEDVESELARIKQLEPTYISDEVRAVGPFQLFQFSDTEGNILECFTRSWVKDAAATEFSLVTLGLATRHPQRHTLLVHMDDPQSWQENRVEVER